jgi:hypothetical protein
LKPQPQDISPSACIQQLRSTYALDGQASGAAVGIGQGSAIWLRTYVDFDVNGMPAAGRSMRCWSFDGVAVSMGVNCVCCHFFIPMGACIALLSLSCHAAGQHSLSALDRVVVVLHQLGLQCFPEGIIWQQCHAVVSGA